MDILARKAAGIRCLAVAAIGIGALTASAPSAHAYVYSSNNQWASWSSGAYTVYNDVWNPNGGSQWLNINNWNSWNISSNFWGGGVKSYANTSFSPWNSIWGWSWAWFSVSTPGGANYDCSFDCWTDAGDEIMIWENWNGVAPAGGVKQWNVNINNTSYNVWQGWVGHNCVSFTRNGQTWSTTEAPNAIISWARKNGYVGGSYVKQIQFGFEVTSTSGWQSFYLNGYNAGWG
jgi:hypothetical protein